MKMHHNLAEERSAGMMRRPYTMLLAVLFTLLMLTLAAAGSLAGPTHFTLIDDPNEPFSNNFAAINNRGQILGNGPSASQPSFVLTGSVYKTISVPFAGALCTGFNDKDQIVGYYVGTNRVPHGAVVTHGFLLAHGVATTLDDPNAGQSSYPGGTYPADINDQGEIVGYYIDANGATHGFLLARGVYTTLDDPNAASTSGVGGSGYQGTTATGINDKGQIVGYYQDVNYFFHGFLLSRGVYTTLDDPNAAQGVAVGSAGTYATSLNDNGQIVGYYTDINGVYHGFLIGGARGPYTTLDDPNALQSAAQSGSNNGTRPVGVDNMGQIVGNYFDASFKSHAFLFDQSMYADAPLDPKARVGGQANGINNEAQIVGNYVDAEGVSHGFFVDRDFYATLDAPDAAEVFQSGLPNGTVANSINDQSQIVGTYYDVNGVAHGFLLDHGAYATLDDPNAVQTGSPNGTYATGINDKGKIVGYYYDATGAGRGFLFSKGAYTTLDDPNAALTSNNGTYITAINNRGQIVGWYIDANQGIHGFLLEKGTYTTLDDPNAIFFGFTFATGINDRGQIIGWYADSNFVAQNFLFERGVYKNVVFPGDFSTIPFCINNTDQVVGALFDNMGVHGFLDYPVR